MIPFAPVQIAGLRALDPTKPSEAYVCGCWDCMPPAEARQRMILCPLCGNKRCPRATCHDNACTKSSEPGQPGSRYA